MITSLLMKPLNAGWLTTLYIVAAGLLSWPTLVVAIGLAESPVDAVLAALAAFVIDPPRGLETATLWAEARKIPLTLAAITTLVAGFVWAMGWLWQRPMLFHKLRGPATAWIMVALLTQLHGRAAILFFGGAVGIVLVGVALMQRFQNVSAQRGVWSGDLGAAGAMFLALVGVVMRPGLAALHLVGGAPPRKRSAWAGSDPSAD